MSLSRALLCLAVLLPSTVLVSLRSGNKVDLKLNTALIRSFKWQLMANPTLLHSFIVAWSSLVYSICFQGTGCLGLRPRHFAVHTSHVQPGRPVNHWVGRCLFFCFAEKVMRDELIRIKILDPHSRFRLEVNVMPRLEVATEQSRVQGLEAPETSFVEESAFKAAFGREPEAHEVVFEEWNGQRMRGVT